MKNNIALLMLVLFLLSACTPVALSPEPTETSIPTSTKTPVPPTATVLPTATATPLPIPIQADNFRQMVQKTSTVIDQSKFVDYQMNEISFDFENSNLPDGDRTMAYFISYQLLNTGDLLGFLYHQPFYCGEHTFGMITERECGSYFSYISMINLTQNTTLWTQFNPVNPAGPEFDVLLAELKITDFVPRINAYRNDGKHVYKWSQDNQLISVPIRVIDFVLVKNVLNGENIIELPMGNNRATWIGALSPDEKMIAYIKGGNNGSMDKLIVFDIESQSIVFQYDVIRCVRDIAWSDDNSLVAIGNSKGGIDIINLSTKEVKYVIERRFDLAESYKQVEDPSYFHGIRGITRLKFSHDHKKLAFTEYNYKSTGEKFSRVILFDLETRQEINSYDADFLQNGYIEWSSDDTFIVTISDFTDGRIILLDENRTVEIPLEAIDGVEDYDTEIFTSQLYFNEDQTQLTLIRSLFTDAVIDVYEVEK